MKNSERKKQLPMIRPDLEIVSDDDFVCAVLVLIYYASRQQQIALSLESSNDTLLNSWEKANSKKAELVGFKVDPMQKSMQKNWNWLQLIFPINLGCNMICCCYCQSTNHLVWKNQLKPQLSRVINLYRNIFYHLHLDIPSSSKPVKDFEIY